jgi:hypothetical protein
MAKSPNLSKNRIIGYSAPNAPFTENGWPTLSCLDFFMAFFIFRQSVTLIIRF